MTSSPLPIAPLAILQADHKGMRCHLKKDHKESASQHTIEIDVELDLLP